MISEKDFKNSVLPHHIKSAYCENRESYRKGKRLTAVKVFTINDESAYLLINNVQSIKLENELLKLVSSFGEVKLFHQLKDYPTEEFEQAFLVQYKCLASAKWAKKKLDESNFYGSMLHVCYAPENETPQEVIDKIKCRQVAVASHIKKLKKASSKSKEFDVNHLNKEPQSSTHKEDLATDLIGPKWQKGYQSDINFQENKTQVHENIPINLPQYPCDSLKLNPPQVGCKRKNQEKSEKYNKRLKLSSTFSFLPRSVACKKR